MGANRAAERWFYTGLATVMLATVFVGFSRTFFLKPWFPESAAFIPPEPFIFFVHGMCATAWILLFAVQPWLVFIRRVDVHRRLGWFGAALATALVVTGTVAALMAAARATGFMGVPVPPLEFLAIPLADLALFATFFAMAVLWRRNLQNHKRLMLLAAIGLVDAAVVRLPLPEMTANVMGSPWTRTDVGVDLFLLPIVVWDLVSRGRVHRVTLLGGLAIIASQPLRLMLSETNAWLAFARWAVGLIGT